MPDQQQPPPVAIDLSYEYSTERLTFEPVEQNEAILLTIQNVMSDPYNNALSTTATPKPFGKEDAKTQIEAFSKCLLSVMICLKPDTGGTDNTAANGDTSASKSKQQIGFMVLSSVLPTLAHNRRSSVGICLAKEYQQRGYGTEALNWLIDWGFRFGNLHSVFVQASSANPTAMHVYTKLGFVMEGRARESLWFDRAWHDMVSFGMLESEWEAIRRRQTNQETNPITNQD